MIEKIQNKVTLKVKWLFHHLGYIIEKVPDENKLYFQLSNSHEAVQKHVLKRVTENIRIANNHTLYNNLLKKYIPEWNCDYSAAVFVGSGIGEYSFNTFRKVCFGESCFFEKVYFNNSYDLLRIEWFHEHINSLLRDWLNIAKIYKIIKGDLITIVYFEFTELKPLSNLKLDVVPFTISQRLIEISNTTLLGKIAERAPEYLKDYKLHAFYKGNILHASKMISNLSNDSLSPDMIEQVVNRQPLVLTHGDIQETNVFADNYLIDWDSFGFFPLGFESAYILYQINYRKSKLSLTSLDLQKILIKNYRTIVDRDLWNGFELSCFYFYFIFIALRENTSPNVMQKDVFARIMQLYKETKL